jgi:hexosaminidase
LRVERNQLISFDLIAQILDHDLPSLSNDTIVTVWQNTSNAKSVAQRGHRIVHASSEYFYLDCGLGGWIGVDGGGNSWCDPYKTWSRIHS